MSRIHDALKKAAEEKSALGAAAATSSEPAHIAEGTVERRPLYAGDHGMGMPELLRFNELKEKCPKAHWKLAPGANVFVNGSRASQAAEQFRTLRSRLYQIRSSKRLKTILVTSGVSAEGKTFVMSNLAQALVRQRDRRVLIIDGDLRRAGQHVALGAPEGPGLADYLSGSADLLSIIQFGPIENLCLIPAGTATTSREPSDLLSGPEFKHLLDLLTPVFDWILIDSPPVVPVADATIMAALCDGVLMVVKADSTDFQLSQKACQEFQEDKLIGVVLNSVEKIAGYDSYAYTYGSDKSSTPNSAD